MKADQGEGGEAGGQGQGGGGAGAQGAGGGRSGGLGGPLGPPGSRRGHPLHRCGGAVAVREKGQGGGRGGRAGKEKWRRGEERGAGEAEGAPRLASPSPEPTLTDWDSQSPPPRQYALPPVRRRTGTVAGWAEGDVAERARYVQWAGKTRGRRNKRGPRPFSDLLGRAGRPRERGPEMEEWHWRRMLGAALTGLRLDCPQEKGRKPRVQMLRELLQREGRYGGDA